MNDKIDFLCTSKIFTISKLQNQENEQQESN